MRKNENGRSMIEMLGVLAIIGVLSVGGIYGYTTAMRKYKANEIVQTASMLATLAHSKNAGQGGVVSISDAGITKPTGLADMCATGPTSDVVEVKIKLTSDDDNNTLCKAITQIAPADSSSGAAAGYYVSCGTEDVNCAGS